ncbi:uncharacterized protein PG998_005603 [Apiospora kogelbergensis]|uniref:uncharacterized protein n=1 Tax=Apiospora kogelbergensis TaxID=1337665 RepID=UPI00312D5F42
MPSPEVPQELLGTEHMGPKGWIRQVLCFELPEDYDIDNVSSILKTAYVAMKARTPPAGLKMVPLVDGSKPGRWQWQRFPEGEIEDFKVSDLRGDFVPFAEFKANEYPMTLLTPEKMGPRSIWPSAADMALWFHTTYMQANFIKGGLLLSMGIFHSSADATSAYVMTKVMTEHIRKAQGLPVPDPVDVSSLLKERKLLDKSRRGHLSSVPKLEDTPEYVLLPFTPEGPPPKILEPIHQANIFHFSPRALDQLKKDAAPTQENLRVLKGDKSGGDLPDFISTNDALNALLWKVVMDVQHPDLEAAMREEPERPSHLLIALDERRRAGMHEHTLGNLLAWAPLFHDLRSVVRDATLADLAVMIRRSVKQRSDDPDFVHKHEAVLNGVEQLDRIAPLVFLDVPGRNTLTSSWRNNTYYGLEWGPVFGDRIKAVRAPSVGVCHGFQVILPDRPDKPGVEMMVGVETPAVGRLTKHPLWTKYAEAPNVY